MKAALRYIKRERYWPLVVLFLGVVVLLPGLRSIGLWEPVEIRIADSARARAGLDTSEQSDDSTHPADQADKPAAASAAAAPAKQKAAAPTPPAPPLTEWSAGQSMKRLADPLGSGELAARLPLVLLGLVALMATFYLGRRMGNPRAGLIAALVLLSFPLFLFQSRQLMSDIGAIAGGSLIVLGMAGLAWPAGNRTEHPPWLYLVDITLVACGAALSYFAAAALLGLFVPFGAVALACAAALACDATASHRSTAAAAAATAAEPTRASPDSRTLLLAGLGLLVLGLAVAAVATLPDGPLTASAGTRLALLALMGGVLLVVLGIVPRRARASRGTPGGTADTRWRRAHLILGTLAAGSVAAVALGMVLARVFDLGGPIPGERALFGLSVIPKEAYVEVLGGAWHVRDNLDATFSSLFEQVAYGLFPWSALAPIALAHLAMGPQRGRATWSGFVLFAWALLAWVVATVMARKVSMVLFPALPAIAVAIGIWLDALLSAREQGDATAASDPNARSSFGMTLRMPLVALFVLAAILTMAKDFQAFPNKLLAINMRGASIEYPATTTVLKVELKAWLLVFGVLFGGLLAYGLSSWHRYRKEQLEQSPLYRLSRYGVHASVAVSVVFALFLTQCWIPAMGRKLSSKHLFTTYDSLREDGEALGLMGDCGTGHRYYASDEPTELKDRNQLIALLRQPGRTFAMVPGAELCPVHRAIGASTAYHVLDNSNAKCLLLSNRLKRNETDYNPLAKAIVRELPQGINTPLAVNYDNKIELIGVTMPERVGRGDSFTMTLYFKVLRPVGGDWKIFAHFDGGGMRFQGDHKPIQDRCGTGFWQPGDYIVDTFTVEAGNITYAKTTYDVHVGFFRGTAGNWSNMPVVTATSQDGHKLAVGKDLRVLIGRLQVN